MLYLTILEWIQKTSSAGTCVGGQETRSTTAGDRRLCAPLSLSPSLLLIFGHMPTKLGVLSPLPLFFFTHTRKHLSMYRLIYTRICLCACVCVKITYTKTICICMCI